jgi:hypothetical protein
MQNEMEIEYNERLFNKKKLRGRLHLSRYFWLEQQVLGYCPKPSSVLELGCYDAKTINFLPAFDYYEGYDANWENGLQIGIASLQGKKNCQLVYCNQLSQFKPSLPQFDICICMETLEHLPLHELETYLQIIAKHTKNYFFVTIPNEKGIVLLIKYLVKKWIFRNVPEPYTSKEIALGTLGKVNLIPRNEGGHKGFDWEVMVRLLEKYFQVISIEGMPYRFLGKHLNFTIGLVLQPLPA